MAEVLSDQDRLKRAVASLRTFIRDKVALNRYLQGQLEHRDDECRQALISALVDWNRTPPIMGTVTLATHPNKPLLLQKATVDLLRGAMMWHSREHVPTSDGGTSADDHDKLREYGPICDRLEADYEKKKGDEKIAMNVAAALGNMSVQSEYAFGEFYGELW